MKITIYDDCTVMDVQQQFRELFPYLHLEFFDLSQNEFSTYFTAGEQYPHVLVSDLRAPGRNGELIIYPNMTMMQFEYQLQDIFGLKAQVFVKFGTRWMRSSLNGYWMLYHKNEEGRRSCQAVDNTPESV